MRRGEVWWASLPEPSRSEPGYRRPVVIIQSDDFTRSSIRTVVVVALTSNSRLASAPGNVLLTRAATGLPRASVANVSQVLTIDKSFLTERVRTLPVHELRSIEEGLRLVLVL